MKYLLILGVMFIGFNLYATQAQSNPSGYHLLDSVRLGGEGGWDLYGLDTAAERLYGL
jgi:hypothetical protein